MALPIGSRPPVSEYLDANYIKAHIAKFEKEGGAFVVRKKADIIESTYISYPARKYIGLKSEMDKLIKEADGDVNYIIKKLDLGDDYLSSKDELYYVTVEPNKGFKFEMPNGNELGANIYWTPGGKTANETIEGVLIGSENVKHERNWDIFINFFGYKNVMKISK